jgi:hypothetical protein
MTSNSKHRQRTPNDIAAIEEQRLMALKEANAIRGKRATVRSAWKAMDESLVSSSVAMLLSDPPDWAKTWRISQVLHQIPHWGDVAVTKRLKQLSIAPETRLVELSPPQRLGLIEVLAPHLLTNEQAL